MARLSLQVREALKRQVPKVAKKDLKIGQFLDGEGGYTVWGNLYPAEKSIAIGGLPIGLANNVRLKNDVPYGSIVRWQDVEIDQKSSIVVLRRNMEKSITN